MYNINVWKYVMWYENNILNNNININNNNNINII